MTWEKSVTGVRLPTAAFRAPLRRYPRHAHAQTVTTSMCRAYPRVGARKKGDVAGGHLQVFWGWTNVSAGATPCVQTPSPCRSPVPIPFLYPTFPSHPTTRTKTVRLFSHLRAPSPLSHGIDRVDEV